MIKKINIPIYNGELVIIQDENLENVKDKYNLRSVENVAALAYKISKDHEFSKYLLAFTFRCTPTMIAHESLHIVAMIYEDRGIYFDNHNDENQCYLLGWIVGRCHEVLQINK